MASLRDLKRRIRSTQNTKQIMRAMQLVSGAKFKRSQARLFEARVVLEFLDGLLQRVLAATPGLDHPLARSSALPRSGHSLADRAFGAVPGSVAPRETGESALVIFTSDTGLCGSYNTNLIQLAEAHLRRDGFQRTRVIYIGKKGHRYFTKRGVPTAATATDAYLDLAGRPNLQKAEAIGRSLMERFLSGRVSSVELLYSRFVSSMVYRPTIQQWLPIQLAQVAPDAAAQAGAAQGYLFEPSAQRVFEDLLPRWALAKFQLVMLEAFTSEHSARMIAMKNATDNAEELIDDLTLQRNKMRQALITKEISEIVGTAEALK